MDTLLKGQKHIAREDYMNGQFMCSHQPSAPHRNMANLVVIQRHHGLNKKTSIPQANHP